MPPASRILLPWLLSTRLPLSLMPLSTQRLYDFHTRSSTARPSLRSGHYIPSGLASYAPVFGSLPTNVVTRPIPSPSLSTTPSAGPCTLRTYFHRSSFPSGSLTVHQSRSSIPLLAYHTWETPRFHRAPNSGSGLRPQDSFLPRPSSLRFCPRGSSGCFRQQEGYERALGGSGRLPYRRLPRICELFGVFTCPLIRSRQSDSFHQLGGWPAYLTLNSSGQKRYPSNTNRE